MINLWKRLKVNQIKKSFSSKNIYSAPTLTSFQYLKTPNNPPPPNLRSFKVIFRVLFRVLSDRVLLRVLSDSISFRVLRPLFLVCRLPSVAWTTWGVLQWLPSLNILTATDVLILSLGNLMQLPEIWASFWN